MLHEAESSATLFSLERDSARFCIPVIFKEVILWENSDDSFQEQVIDFKEDENNEMDLTKLFNKN